MKRVFGTLSQPLSRKKEREEKRGSEAESPRRKKKVDFHGRSLFFLTVVRDKEVGPRGGRK